MVVVGYLMANEVLGAELLCSRLSNHNVAPTK
jgi:hypothetical protein